MFLSFISVHAFLSIFADCVPLKMKSQAPEMLGVRTIMSLWRLETEVVGSPIRLQRKAQNVAVGTAGVEFRAHPKPVEEGCQ